MKTSGKEQPALGPAESEADEACQVEESPVLEEIVIEELAVDGICGIY